MNISPPPIKNTIAETGSLFSRIWSKWFSDLYAYIDERFTKQSEYKPKVYDQDAEPTLTADNTLAVWKDTNDSDRIYLVFRRGSSDQVKVELT